MAKRKTKQTKDKSQSLPQLPPFLQAQIMYGNPFLYAGGGELAESIAEAGSGAASLFSGGAGAAASSIGQAGSGAAASASEGMGGNPGLGMAISAGGQLLGAGIDAIARPDHYDRINVSKNAWKGAASGATTGAQMGMMLGPLGAGIGAGIGAIGGGLLARGKAKKEAKKLSKDLKAQYYPQEGDQFSPFKQNEYGDTTGLPELAYGGPLFAQGGQMGPLDMTQFNGNTHEEGGINLGGKAEVEDGEVRVGNYIFSDRLKHSSKKKSFADLAKAIDKKYSRKNDGPSDRAKQIELEELSLENDLAKNEAQAAEQQEQQAMAMAADKAQFGQEQMGMPPMMAMGGNLDMYAYGGPTNPPILGQESRNTEMADYSYLFKQPNLQPESLIQKPTPGFQMPDMGLPMTTGQEQLPSGKIQTPYTPQYVGAGQNTNAPMEFSNNPLTEDMVAYMSSQGITPTTEAYSSDPGAVIARIKSRGDINTPQELEDALRAEGLDPNKNKKAVEEVMDYMKAKGQDPGGRGHSKKSSIVGKKFLKSFNEVDKDIEKTTSRKPGTIDSGIKDTPGTISQLPAEPSATNVDNIAEAIAKGGAKGAGDAAGESGGGFNTDKAAYLSALVPAAANFIRGMSADTTKYARYTPQKVSLDKQRQIASRQSALERAIARESARGSGQSSGAAAARQAAMGSAIAEQLAQGNLQSYLQEQMTNADILNQARQMNTQISNKEIDANEANRMAARLAQDTGLADMSLATQGYFKDQKATAINQQQNEFMRELINAQTMYAWERDENGKLKPVFKKQ